MQANLYRDTYNLWLKIEVKFITKKIHNLI